MDGPSPLVLVVTLVVVVASVSPFDDTSVIVVSSSCESTSFSCQRNISFLVVVVVLCVCFTGIFYLALRGCPLHTLSRCSRNDCFTKE